MLAVRRSDPARRGGAGLAVRRGGRGRATPVAVPVICVILFVALHNASVGRGGKCKCRVAFANGGRGGGYHGCGRGVGGRKFAYKSRDQCHERGTFGRYHPVGAGPPLRAGRNGGGEIKCLAIGGWWHMPASPVPMRARWCLAMAILAIAITGGRIRPGLAQPAQTMVNRVDHIALYATLIGNCRMGRQGSSGRLICIGPNPETSPDLPPDLPADLRAACPRWAICPHLVRGGR